MNIQTVKITTGDVIGLKMDCIVYFIFEEEIDGILITNSTITPNTVSPSRKTTRFTYKC